MFTKKEQVKFVFFPVTKSVFYLWPVGQIERFVWIPLNLMFNQREGIAWQNL